MSRIQMLVQKVARPLENIEGSNAIEYGVIAALVSVVIIVTLGPLGAALAAVFGSITPLL